MFSSLVLATTIAASLQVAPGQPIDIASCNVQAPQAIAFDSLIPGQVTIPGSVTISFVNRQAQPANTVDFAITEGGRTYDLVSRGTFSQGTTIVKTFDADVDGNGGASCGVNAVNYGSGLAWAR
jgi:hypothetical protein